MYYEVRGRGKPLLLLSGLNSDSTSWAGVRPALEKRFKVIVFDNRGSGRSTVPPGPYTIRDMASDAAALLDALGISRCGVVGHSMGGYIAQQLAADRPGLVDGLVLEATAAVSSRRNNALFRDLSARFEKDRDAQALMRSWSYWLFSEHAFCRKGYVESFVRYACAYPYIQSPRGFKGQVAAVASFDGRKLPGRIKARTLVLAGADDILIYPRESMELAAGIRGSSYKVIKNAGHCIHIEAWREFVRIVTGYIGR